LDRAWQDPLARAGRREEVITGIVLSTAAAMATFIRMMSPQDVPVSVRERLQRAPLSHLALGIRLGLANRIDEPGFAVNHAPLMEEQYQMLAPQPAGIRWLSSPYRALFCRN
jgi:phytoene desaturase